MVNPEPSIPDPLSPEPLSPEPLSPDPLSPEPLSPEPGEPEPLIAEPLNPPPGNPERLNRESGDSEPLSPESERPGSANAESASPGTAGGVASPAGEPGSLLAATLDAIEPTGAEARATARDRLDRMTKPRGSLGRLEDLAVDLAGIAGSCPPPVPEPAAVAVFAGDHGVHAQGVSPWPQEVTAQMVANFLAGGAVVNAFARQIGAEVCVIDVGVIDVGVAAVLPTGPGPSAVPGLISRKVRAGTADLTAGPALTREDATRAVEVGIETAGELVAAGNRLLIPGDMGIANTTASAALICAVTGAPAEQATGRGTGIDDATLAHKTEIVRRALALHLPERAAPDGLAPDRTAPDQLGPDGVAPDQLGPGGVALDGIGLLAAFGGLEHAAIAGLILGGAAQRVPVLLDGVNVGAAALVASLLAPGSIAYCVAGHRSAEPGHALALAHLGLEPLVALDLRLGEGTGALLALPLVQSAARALGEVATFDSAGVSDKQA